jgi:hypothetical protein
VNPVNGSWCQFWCQLVLQQHTPRGKTVRREEKWVQKSTLIKSVVSHFATVPSILMQQYSKIKNMDFKSPAYAIPPPGHIRCKPISRNHMLQDWGLVRDGRMFLCGGERDALEGFKVSVPRPSQSQRRVLCPGHPCLDRGN